jgi:hypothetical protein
VPPKWARGQAFGVAAGLVSERPSQLLFGGWAPVDHEERPFDPTQILDAVLGRPTLGPANASAVELVGLAYLEEGSREMAPSRRNRLL